MSRRFDAIIYGASGYTGRQVIAYLARRAPQIGARWAIAGRNEAKLREVAGSVAGAPPEILLAEATNAAQLRALAEQTATVVNLAGPYTGRADALLTACVDAGTDYLDLCGENRFIRELIDRRHAHARAREVKLIPCCGYEALPFDLGVLAVHNALRVADGSRCRQVDVEAGFDFKDGLLGLRDATSGGTAATTFVIMQSQCALNDPYQFVPDAAPSGDALSANTQRLDARPSQDGSRWLAPLIPHPFLNPAVIHRTHALCADDDALRYASDFVYREAFDTNSVVPRGLASTTAHMFSAFARRLEAMANGRRNVTDRLAYKLLEQMMPAPGDGPDPAALDRFDYQIRFRALSSSGRTATATLDGAGSPGYRSTANIIAEAALLLAKARGDTPAHFGVVTPAAGLGLAFVERFGAVGLGLRIEVGE